MNAFLFFVRCVMSLVWLYNGLWLKILAPMEHHRVIVRSVFGGEHADAALLAIGGGETLLALGILSGLAARFVNGFQILLLVGMNGIGILLGGGSIPDPAGLLISNLPLVACALLVAIFGPGTWSLRRES